MSQRGNEKFVVFIATIGSLALITVSILLSWEFWAPFVIAFGMVALWGVNLTDRLDDGIRRMYYFGYAMLLLFYHGIHSTSLFDCALAIVMVMVIYSMFNSIYMMNGFLMEFFLLVLIHIFHLPGGESLNYDVLNISRLILHSAVALAVYYTTVRMIGDRLDNEEERKIQEDRTEQNEASMEDFLSNISHELRTPVNVVNGMSDLLIKKGVGKEAEAIKTAGVRLAHQIEDIQDYTECKRGKIFVEEDNYMSTSLINDVVTSFRMSDKTGDLELIVDLDPSVPTLMRGDIKKLHKIFRHLLENAIKFTRRGGIYVRMYSEKREYGVNLTIEMTDTGIGMDRYDIQSVTEGMYQANKKRNRSSGGIGLGLFVVYGFAHSMGGFVKIESEKENGTTIRVTIPQSVVDARPCLSLEDSFDGTVLFHVKPGKYSVPKLRDFYRNMAANLATGIRVPLYSAETLYEVERLKDKLNVSHIFMGQKEYEENSDYFEKLAKENIVIAVTADRDFIPPNGSRIIVMPKPLYAYPIIKILNDGWNVQDIEGEEEKEKPVFTGIRALIVDDEPMNLVVATSLFREYEMVIETADSGKEAIRKFRENEYDIIFMDHMMPEMDGVEAMKLIKADAENLEKNILVVALTANAVSGAREMFIKEGFDGFIAKPIQTADFERVMMRVLSKRVTAGGGEAV